MNVEFAILSTPISIYRFRNCFFITFLQHFIGFFFHFQVFRSTLFLCIKAYIGSGHPSQSIRSSV